MIFYRRILMIVFTAALSAWVMLFTSCAQSGACSSFLSAMNECDVFLNDIGTTSELVRQASSFPARAGHTSLVFDGKMWVIGGGGAALYNDAWYSADGAQWYAATTNAAFIERANHASAVFDGKMWIIGGTIDPQVAQGQTFPGKTNMARDIWSSRDGAAWTQEGGASSVTARLGHTALVFGRKLWVIGGLVEDPRTTNPTGFEYANDVWSSSDGKTWKQETQSAAFPQRANHASAVFDGKMWIIGGFGTALYNDAWSSSDGITWTRETAGAEFSPRQNMAVAPFARRLWVVGGRTGSALQAAGDVWVLRKDGTWVAAPEAVTPRARHTVVTFNEKLFVIGGADGAQQYNDVWTIE